MSSKIRRSDSIGVADTFADTDADTFRYNFLKIL